MIDHNSSRMKLAAIHRILAFEGLNEGTWTHLSCRFGEGNFLITPGNTHFSMITVSSLLEYSRDGELLVAGEEANHDALPIHLPIYRARKDVNCILHLHSPSATALTLSDDLALNTRASQTAAYFHGKVAYLNSYIVPRSNAEEGEIMREALSGRLVLMMRNHGVLVAAPTLEHAAVAAYQLERACKQQILALSSGKRLVEMDEAYAKALASEHCNGEPGYLRGMMKLLSAQGSDFSN